MKKFLKPKSYDQILADAKAAGFEVDTYDHDNGGDTIKITANLAGEQRTFILYTFNGRFMGRLPDGSLFTERSELLDGVTWYAALLDFIYVPLPPADEHVLDPYNED
jgi:hypothetical protein